MRVPICLSIRRSVCLCSSACFFPFCLPVFLYVCLYVLLYYSETADAKTEVTSRHHLHMKGREKVKLYAGSMLYVSAIHISVCLHYCHHHHRRDHHRHRYHLQSYSVGLYL